MKFLLFLLLFPFVLMGQKTSSTIPHRPKLIVGIVVEQMRYDYMTKLWTVFDETGFRRLVDYGTECKNASFDYAFTQSSPGYATISTGSNPSDHGIVGEKWYNRLLDVEEGSVTDQNYKTVGGKPFEDKSSPNKLLTTTLGDQMKLGFNNKSKIYSIGLDPEAAVLSAGFLADGAFWFDQFVGQWCTSSYYMEVLPEWLERFNGKKQPEIFLEGTWVPIKNDDSYFVSEDDMNDFEIGFKERTYFPYSILKLSDSYKKYRILTEVPQGDALVKNLAFELIKQERLGKDYAPDLLTINFNAGRNVAERFGIQSKEIQDVYLRLDKEIGSILQFLDEEIGKENCLVYVTSSSGASSYPKYADKYGVPNGYFKHMQAIALLKTYLNAVYGKAEWVKYYNKQQIYLDRSLIEKSNLKLREVQTIAANFLIQFSGVANVLTSTSLLESNFSNGVYRKMQNSYSAKRSGDLFIILEAGWIEQTVNACTDNNSPYTYDTHVPLLWWGWKIKSDIIYRPVSISDIVPTISSLLNIEPPLKSTGGIIWELMGTK